MTHRDQRMGGLTARELLVDNHFQALSQRLVAIVAQLRNELRPRGVVSG